MIYGDIKVSFFALLFEAASAHATPPLQRMLGATGGAEIAK